MPKPPGAAQYTYILDVNGNPTSFGGSSSASKYTYVDRTGTGLTSGTAGTWTVLAAANTSNRQLVTIENLSTTATLTIGYGLTGSEVVLAGGAIPPNTGSGNNILQVGGTQQINIKADAASVAYRATEGVYS